MFATGQHKGPKTGSAGWPPIVGRHFRDNERGNGQGINSAIENVNP
jgi:hypothetical protein